MLAAGCRIAADVTEVGPALQRQQAFGHRYDLLALDVAQQEIAALRPGCGQGIVTILVAAGQ